MNTFKMQESWVMEKLSGIILCCSRKKEIVWISSIAIIFCCVIFFLQYSESSESHPLDVLYLAFLFLLMIVVSCCVVCLKERKSSEVMNSFRNLYPLYASVIRDGKKVRIPEKDIVVGDLVLLKAGCRVPADIRITQSWDLMVNQKPIISGQGSVLKSPECTHKDPTLSQNVVFYSSICVEGYGQGIAIATGERTSFGQMLKTAVVLQKMNTILYRKMREIIWHIGLITTAFCVLFLIIAILRKVSWVTLITLFLAQVLTSMPFSLNLAITASFYWTAKRMVSRHCLPKDYEAVEKISSVTVICCDMTGTITQNRMTVVELFLDAKLITAEPSEGRTEINLSPLPHDQTWIAFARAACLCSTIASKSRRDRCVIKKGCSCNQIEVAIMEFLNNTTGSGTLSQEVIEYIRNQYKKVFEIPFDTVRNYHITIHDTNDSRLEEGCRYIMCMQGAVEVLLRFCSTVVINGEDVPIEQLNYENFQTTFEKVMKNGERVMGYCDYKLPEDKYPAGYSFKDFQESDINFADFRFLGFVSIMDPPRSSIPAAIANCKESGIKVILMTSDHPIAGRAIARQVGIISPESETVEEIAARLSIAVEEVPPGHATAAVFSGTDVDSREKELPEILEQYDELVFARIYPDQKRQVVVLLQRKGEVVAVTGNSLEDSIAMSQADLGVGMGRHGTDLCREVADIILLGDNFQSLVLSIVEGRLIYENLRKVIAYVLSSNVPKISPLIVVCMFFVPLPMGPTFILFITLIAEILPVLYITTQGPDTNIMNGRRFGALNFFDHRLIQKSYLYVGILGLLGGLFVYFMIMAQSGFLPQRIIGLARTWDSSAINDLTDSFGQEWTFSSRKSLEYTCQTAFFLSIIIIQCFNFVISRTHIYHTPTLKLSLAFIVTSVLIPGFQLLVILLLMYTPYVSKAFHFYPLKLSEWLTCFPFAIVLLILEELRRFTLRHSRSSSWLDRELF